MKKRVIILAVLFAGVYLLFPAELVVAPAWTVHVIDAKGQPLEGAVVYETWQDYSVQQAGDEERKTTDVSGTVAFPERHMRVMPLLRFLGGLRNVARYGVHASFGPHSHVGAFKTGYGNNLATNHRDSSWAGDRAGPKQTVWTLILCTPGEKRGGCDLQNVMPTELKDAKE